MNIVVGYALEQLGVNMVGYVLEVTDSIQCLLAGNVCGVSKSKYNLTRVWTN